jgi:hypothetical protein
MVKPDEGLPALQLDAPARPGMRHDGRSLHLRREGYMP